MGKVKRTLFGVLVVCLVALPLSGFAGVWETDFENADGWNVVEGDWGIEDGVYQRTDMTPTYGKSIYLPGDWLNYTLEVDVTILEGGADSASIAAGVLLRTDETGSSGYRIWGRPDQHGFQLSVWQDNTFTHVITDPDEKSILGQTHHLKVQIDGFIISAWFDDNLKIDNYEDVDQLFPTGLIGLINYNAHAQYDNLRVTSDAIDTVSAVTPGSKLTATWGSLKILVD
jgi:hypothetical protein